MEEAERLADRIYVLVDGAVRAHGAPATLGGRDRAAATIAVTLPPGVALPAAVAPRARALGRGRVEVRSSDPMRDLHDVSGWALAAGLELTDIEVRRPSLEDVYLALTAPAGERRAA